MTAARRWWWLAVPIALLAAAHVWFYFPRTVDDMFIFLRYAENAAHGDGLVYNLGERVEGFSSVTWVALLTVGALLGASLVTWSKAMAIASLVALLVGQYLFVRERLGVAEGADPRSWRRAIPYLAPAFTACCSYVVSWTMLGLETPLYVALLVWSAVTLGRYLDRPSRRTLIAAGLVCGSFTLSRPEAPMMLIAIAGGLAIQVRSKRELVARIKRVALGLAPGAAMFAAYAIFRRIYFGLWLPHTAYAKTGDRWHTKTLRQLVGDGASVFEILLVFGGIAIALWALWRRRDAVILAVTSATIVFAARVQIDWMPNVRFWLPLWVMLPMIWLWAIDQLASSTDEDPGWRRVRRIGVIASILLVLATMIHQARIDIRHSVFGWAARGKKFWNKPKTMEMVRNTWTVMSHEWTEEIAKQEELEMGQVTQVFRVIESDARPLAETWFVGPDIGLVGFATPVNVWEPPGLFTPDVRLIPRGPKGLSPELVHAALDRPVVMSELFDSAWTDAISKNPEYAKRFEPVAGWYYIRERGFPKPSKEEIRARYEAALAKLPTSYFIMNLHGLALGAQVHRRVTIVRAKL